MGSEQQSFDRDRLTSDEWRRICAVLDHVLDAESTDLWSIVEAACRAEGVAIADAIRYLKATREGASFLKHLDPVLVTAALGPGTVRRSLSAGTCLGHYEVLAPIATGGMAEVYRAHDTTLDRDVALKVLPPRFAIDAERLMRFKREAHVLASLNHPNVAGIYGFEEFTSASRQGEIVLALALEFVEGRTLADCLADGPLASGPALSIAHQIIDALEAAHDAGIVHRDLKPANIKLREATTGRSHEVVVKVLDFGVAKVLNAMEPDVDPARVDHASDGGTRAGMMVGTVGYMAPEQIEGKPIDQRADIWAFGCVLYEMLTGARAFGGGDGSDTLEQIAIREPDWSRLPVDTPSSVQRLLCRCLERDRRRRLAHIADARLDLDDAEVDRSTDPDRVTAPRRGAHIALLAAAAFALAFGAATAGFLWGRQAPRERPLVTRLTIPVAGNIDQPAVSPNGSQVAFVSRVPTRRIVTRRLDRSEEQTVAGTEDATVPTFSPDGRWLAYRTTVQIDGADVSRLKKIPVTGGTAVTLVDSVAPNGGHVSWGEDDYIYYVDYNDVLRVRSAGGPPQRVVTRDAERGDRGFSNPAVLPGGKWLLVTVSVAPMAAGEPGHTRAVAFNLRTGERRVLLPDDGPATYVQTEGDPSTSHLLYARDGAVFAVPFDARRIEVSGPAVRIIQPGDGVTLAPNLPVGVSKGGTLAYVVRRSDAMVQAATLVWVDRHGTETPIPDLPPRPYRAPRISPEGKRAALNILRGGQRGVLSDVWTYDFATRRLLRATFDGHSVDGSAVWSPDGTRLIYAARSDGQTTELAEVATDGNGGTMRLQSIPRVAMQPPSVPVPRSISPDGKFLIGTVAGSGRPAVFRMVLDSPGTPAFEPLLDTRMVEMNPQYSPNGRWVAYESNRSGRRAIWVAPHEHPAGRWQQVSADRGTDPKWSGTGQELFYRDGGKMMVVAVDTGTIFQAGTPKLLFEGPYRDGYDVSADGRRFLMIKTDGPASRSVSDAERELHLVVNWTEELRRLSVTQH